MKHQLQTEFTLQDLNTIEWALRVQGQDKLAKIILEEIDEIESEETELKQCEHCGIDCGSIRCGSCEKI